MIRQSRSTPRTPTCFLNEENGLNLVVNQHGVHALVTRSTGKGIDRVLFLIRDIRPQKPVDEECIFAETGESSFPFPKFAGQVLNRELRHRIPSLSGHRAKGESRQQLLLGAAGKARTGARRRSEARSGCRSGYLDAGEEIGVFGPKRPTRQEDALEEVRMEATALAGGERFCGVRRGGGAGARSGGGSRARPSRTTCADSPAASGPPRQRSEVCP